MPLPAVLILTRFVSWALRPAVLAHSSPQPEWSTLREVSAHQAVAAKWEPSGAHEPASMHLALTVVGAASLIFHTREQSSE